MRCSTCGGELDSSGACGACATLLHARPVSIPGYRTLSLLGHGGMGAVWLGEDIALERKVAIKVISERDADPDSQTRFVREARALASVDHPSVIRVHTYGLVDGNPYFVMEYVEGKSLGERLAEERTLPVREALRIALEVVDALEAAWEKRIVHRDIKPANILLDRRGRVRVADFGLAKPVASADDTAESSVTRTGSILGSPHYIAPEQAQGLGADFRSDIYSLGVVLYEMLAGQRPFRGTTPLSIISKHLHEPLPDVRLERDDVSEDVTALIEWMTRKDPRERPSSYEELREGLRALATGDAPARTAPSPAVATIRTPILGILPPIVLLLLVIAFGAAIIVANRARAGDAPAAVNGGGALRIAIAPFYGPDELSAREGRVMAALAERSIRAKLPKASLIGIEETATSVRTHDEARALGRKSGASIVVWGESFVLGGESEVKPYFTLVDVAITEGDSGSGDASADPALFEQESSPVRVATTAPNQIDMRRMSAEEVGGMVSFLAGLHALYAQNDPKRALAFFEGAPRSPTMLREMAKAQVAGHEIDQAIATYRELLDADPADAGVRSELADVLVMGGRLREAFRTLAESPGGAISRGRYAVVHQGRLAACQFHFLRNEPFFSDFLLVADAEGKVLERHGMPGEVTALASEGDSLRVTVWFRVEGKAGRGELTYQNGRFDPPLSFARIYGLRFRQVQSGFAPAENFVTEITGRLHNQPANAKFQAKRDLIEGKASTLPELEREMRRAIADDPTQPWYLWVLGEALFAQGRRDEAVSVWSGMLARDFPGVGYFNFSWMARYFQRLGQHDWAFRAIERARALRESMPQPISSSLLLDRLTGAPFQLVHPAQPLEPEMRWRYLDQARNLTGPVEGDHIASAAWARHFERTGRGDLAAREWEIYKRAVDDPFNFPALAARIDYLCFLLAAAAGTFVTLLLLLVARGWSSAARDVKAEHARRAQASRAARFAILAILGAAIGTTVWAAGAAWLGERRLLFGFAWIIVAAAIIGSAWASGRTWRAIFLRVERRAATALLLTIVVFAGVALAFNAAVRKIDDVSMGLPFGFSDALGHPVIVDQMVKLAATRDSGPVVEVAAVSMQLAGRWEESAALYRKLGDAPRAREGLDRVERRDPRPLMPPPDDLLSGLVRLRTRFLPMDPRESESIVLFVVLVGEIALLVLGVLVTAAWLLLRRPAGEGEPDRGLELLPSRWTSLLLPGAWDIGRGRAMRGTALLFGFVLLAVAAFAVAPPRMIPAFGPLSTFRWANTWVDVFNRFPLPPEYRPLDSRDAWEYSRLEVMRSHPHADVLFVFIGALALAVASIHLARLPRIWRATARPRPLPKSAAAPPLPA